MFFEYKNFLLEKAYEKSSNEIILIILAFFIFFLFTSIVYNIYIFIYSKYNYKKKLLKIESEFILLKDKYKAGMIDIDTYKRRTSILNKKSNEVI